MRTILACWLGGLLALSTTAPVPVEAQPTPLPNVPREMRGIWVATVSNIDWPKTSDSVSTQQTKLRAILDKALELHCNTIVFQIRPACDALYQSDIEPWSQWLTGRQGRAPSPVWDPLQYAIDQCHQRGLELHAWFNPYRAGFTSTSYFDPAHVKNEHPEWVRTYGSYYWLDPGDPNVPAYSLSVVMDVVNRYDIDGIHIDDYFYPYPDGNEFPDSTTYAQYGNGLSLGDWRRKNVDDFIETMYDDVKAAKPWVKVGISPFGIWRPGNPPGITGLDSYSEIYGDSKKWLNQGWIDYYTPQLYWPIDQVGQQYPLLLDWWISENTHGRQIAPGLFTSKISYGGSSSWVPSEIVNQVTLTQGRTGAVGNVHFSARQFMASNGGGGLNTLLENGPYAQKALVPTAPWLDNVAPAAPEVSFEKDSATGRWRVSWTPRGTEDARYWVAYWYANGKWSYDILTSERRDTLLTGTGASLPEWAIVTSVDRLGNESDKVTVHLTEVPMTGWTLH